MIIFASTHFARCKTVVIPSQTRYCKYPSQIIFSTFPDQLAARARWADRQKSNSDFCLRIVRRGHYGNNRSRISPPINSGNVYKPRIYDRERCWCNMPVAASLLLLLLLPPLLLLLLLLLLHRGATVREWSREPY